MKKRLKEVVEKLDRSHISTLSSKELSIYYEHRLETILQKKYVLTFPELLYLLSETGPGNRRFDPRSLPLLTKTQILLRPSVLDPDEAKKLERKKRKIDAYTELVKNSNEMRGLILKILGSHVKNLSPITEEPFVINGEFRDIPITVLIKNGDWIFPNKELFSFLKEAQTNKKFPIIIAKKIHGILFPVFKNISVLGLNLYKTYLPKEAEKLIKDATSHSTYPFKTLTYNGQFRFIEENNVINNEIGNFFETTLSNHIAASYKEFVELKISIHDNLPDTVSQFRKNKATRGLLESFEFQEKTLKDLASLD